MLCTTHVVRRAEPAPNVSGRRSSPNTSMQPSTGYFYVPYRRRLRERRLAIVPARDCAGEQRRAESKEVDWRGPEWPTYVGSRGSHREWKAALRVWRSGVAGIYVE